MTRTLIALLLMSSPAYACGQHDETGNDTFEIEICASNTAYCVMGDEYVPCEDIPTFVTPDEDYEPYTAAEVAAWRGIETSGGNDDR